jgi:hypothetical protein
LDEGVMKTRISGKEAARVAEDMAKPGPIRVAEPREVQEAAGALVPSAGSELDRKVPPRVRKPLPRNDQWKAPTPDLEGHRKRLREALGNTLSDEFVDVILGKLVEALRPGLYDQLEEATLNAALATIDSIQPRSELQVLWPLTVRGQQPAMPVVGFVYSGVPELSTGVVAAFRKGLGESGFTEGRNVTVEFRFDEGARQSWRDQPVQVLVLCFVAC